MAALNRRLLRTAEIERHTLPPRRRVDRHVVDLDAADAKHLVARYAPEPIADAHGSTLRRARDDKAVAGQRERPVDGQPEIAGSCCLLPHHELLADQRAKRLQTLIGDGREMEDRRALEGRSRSQY